MIIIDRRRSWDPRVAQTGLKLPGAREYNDFLNGDDNNRYKVEEGPPCVAQTGLILPGGRSIMVSWVEMIIIERRWRWFLGYSKGHTYTLLPSLMSGITRHTAELCAVQYMTAPHNFSILHTTYFIYTSFTLSTIHIEVSTIYFPSTFSSSIYLYIDSSF